MNTYTHEVPPLPGHRPVVVDLPAFRVACECGHPSTPCPAKVAQIDAALRDALTGASA
jgi:hypothetical protein